MIIELGLDTGQFKTKPKGLEIPKIVNSISNVTIDTQALAEAISNGQTIRPCVIDGDKSFISQQVFALDFDDAPYKVVLAIAQAANIFPAIAYSTFSQDSNAPLTHFRLLFLSDHVIQDRRVRDAILQHLLDLFEGYCDAKCRDTSRLFFGSSQQALYLDCAYDFEKLWSIDPSSLSTEGEFVTKKGKGQTHTSPDKK